MMRMPGWLEKSAVGWREPAEVDLRGAVRTSSAEKEGVRAAGDGAHEPISGTVGEALKLA